MSRVLHPLLLICARVTHHELARMLQHLKVENAILRSKLPKVIQVTPRERQGKRLVGHWPPEVATLPSK